jgi:hypothetical protein
LLYHQNFHRDFFERSTISSICPNWKRRAICLTALAIRTVVSFAFPFGSDEFVDWHIVVNIDAMLSTPFGDQPCAAFDETA